MRARGFRKLTLDSGFEEMKERLHACPCNPSFSGRGFGAFSEIHLFDAWEKIGITDRRRGLRRIGSRSESRGTSAGLDFVGYRPANARRNRSGSTNPQALP